MPAYCGCGMTAKDERTAVLVIRAWTEADDRVRARLTESQRVSIRDDELGGMPVDAPERRAEAAGCTRLRAVEPEGPGDVRAQHGPLVQRDERDDALGAAGKRNLGASDFDPEPGEQVQHDLFGGTIVSPRGAGVRPQG